MGLENYHTEREMGSLEMKDGHRNMKESGKLSREPREECSKGRIKISYTEIK